MSTGDGDLRVKASAVTDSEADFVEIVSPVADAMGVLADLIAEVRDRLSGASIAKSDQGTLLLNGYAWELFGDRLNEALPNLVVARPARSESKALKFLLVVSGPSRD